MGPLLNEGLRGMQQSYQKMTQSAQQIARQHLPQGESSRQGELQTPATASADNLVKPIVEMKQQQHIFTASAKVVSVASDTIGSLIDDLR